MEENTIKCHCQQFVLLNPEAEHEPGTASFDAIRHNSIVHTVKSCLHERDVLARSDGQTTLIEVEV